MRKFPGKIFPFLQISSPNEKHSRIPATQLLNLPAPSLGTLQKRHLTSIPHLLSLQRPQPVLSLSFYLETRKKMLIWFPTKVERGTVTLVSPRDNAVKPYPKLTMLFSFWLRDYKFNAKKISCPILFLQRVHSLDVTPTETRLTLCSSLFLALV